MSSKQQRYKIISIGDEETSLGFKLSGITNTYTVQPQKAGVILRKVAEDPELAVLIVTEEVVQANADIVARIKLNPFPVIVEVPGRKAKFNNAEDKIRKLVNMALGIDID